MKASPLILGVIVSCLTSSAIAQDHDLDTELTGMATKLAATADTLSKKKVSVLDFTDLEGGASELGKYVAEQLTVDLVIVK
jgi:hypothetical protein